VSWKVTELVVDQSRSKHGARVVLLVLAEKASADGIALIRQAPPEPPRRAPRGHERENLQDRARLSKRQVRRATKTLQLLDELEVLERWVGRNRDYVYRILVGALRSMDVDYDQLKISGLAGRFWTPEELMLPVLERPVDGHVLPVEPQRPGDILSPGETGDEGTSATATRGQIVRDEGTFATDAHLISARGPSKDRSTGPSLTSSVETTEEVAAGAAASRGDQIKELIVAFAETVGVYPETRENWAGWSRAFAPLVDDDVDGEQVRLVTRSYLERWPEYKRDPFALTKLWQLLQVALERNQLTLWRWASETSWKLPEDEVAWLLETALMNDEQRTALVKLAGEARRAHANAEAEFLRWVENEGFAVDDDVWRKRLTAEVRKFKTRGPEMRRRATERRLELREALANLDLQRDVA
jgi:hypothetical protein